MSAADYRVADISLADFGRKEIEIAGTLQETNALFLCRLVQFPPLFKY